MGIALDGGGGARGASEASVAWSRLVVIIVAVDGSRGATGAATVEAAGGGATDAAKASASACVCAIVEPSLRRPDTAATADKAGMSGGRASAKESTSLLVGYLDVLTGVGVGVSMGGR